MNRSFARVLTGLAALLMLSGGTVHSLAYHKAAAVVEASNLSNQYVAIFKGLWLNDSAIIIVLGLAYLTMALWPTLSARTALLALGLLPLGSAVSLYVTVGNFPPAHLLLASATMVVLAALLPYRSAGTVRGKRAAELPGTRAPA